MGKGPTKYPFELPYSEVRANLDTYVDAVFSCLESEFLVMPKGMPITKTGSASIVEYPIFIGIIIFDMICGKEK